VREEHPRIKTQAQRPVATLGAPGQAFFSFSELPDALTTIDPLKVNVHVKSKGGAAPAHRSKVCVMDTHENNAAVCVGQATGVGRKICDMYQHCVEENIFRLDPTTFNRFKKNGEIVLQFDPEVPTDPEGVEVFLQYVGVQCA